jgi:hypothetical protein
MGVKLHNINDADAVVIATEDIGNQQQAQRIKVILGSNGLDDGNVSASNPMPVKVADQLTVDLAANILVALKALIHPIWEEASSGRLRVVLDPIGGVQTLGTVSSVSTLGQVGSVPANSFIYDQMHAAWAGSVRRAIT